MEALDKRDNADRKLGAFVTNKWLVGVLVALIISMGGYIFQTKDRLTDAQAADISKLQREVATHDIELASIRERNMAQYNEILRRLERIERNQDGRAPRREING